MTYVTHKTDTIEIDVCPVASETKIVGRTGSFYEARIIEIQPKSCSLQQVNDMLVGQEIGPLGRITGVEMFCVDQRAGSKIMLLIDPSQNH